MIKLRANYELFKIQVDFIEKSLLEISEMCSNQKKNLTKKSEAMTDEEVEFLLADEHFFFTYEFPYQNNNIYLVSLFSFFENYLISLCDSFCSIKNIDSYFIKSRESVFNRLKQFMNDNGIVFDFATSEWCSIRSYYRIRNCIVHGGAKWKHLEENEQCIISNSTNYFIVKHLMSEDEDGDVQRKPIQFFIDNFLCIVDLSKKMVSFAKSLNDAFIQTI